MNDREMLLKQGAAEGLSMLEAALFFWLSEDKCK